MAAATVGQPARRPSGRVPRGPPSGARIASVSVHRTARETGARGRTPRASLQHATRKTRQRSRTQPAPGRARHGTRRRVGTARTPTTQGQRHGSGLLARACRGLQRGRPIGAKQMSGWTAHSCAPSTCTRLSPGPGWWSSLGRGRRAGRTRSRSRCAAPLAVRGSSWTRSVSCADPYTPPVQARYVDPLPGSDGLFIIATGVPEGSRWHGTMLPCVLVANRERWRALWRCCWDWM